MSVLIEERLAVEHGSLNWMRPGDDQSPRESILFLHGVLRRWQTFAPLYSGLAFQRKVCGLDFPGHGRSDRWAGGYQVIDYVAAATEFVRRHCPQPLVLYGHSLGAMVAAGVAAELGSRVRAVILEDPPLETMGSRIRQTPWHSYFTAIQALVRDGDFRSAPRAEQARRLAEVVTTDPATGKSQRLGDMRDAAAIRFLASCLAAVDPEVLQPIVAGQWLAGYDWQRFAGRITAPVLLLQADPAAGGMLVDDEARAFAAAAGDVTLVRLAGAGHNLHTARTQDVLNLTTQFLDTLP